MGAVFSKSEPGDDAERRPLLTESDQNGGNGSVSQPEKAARWVIRNAIAVFLSVLILAVIIVMCVFFGSKYIIQTVWADHYSVKIATAADDGASVSF